MSYAYNALFQYKKAISILKKAIENNSKNYYFFRELGYSYCKLKQLDKAEAAYKEGIKISNNDFEKSEMAVNMAQAYFLAKNRKKFNHWAKLTKKFAKKDSQYSKYIHMFEKEWGKK